MKPNQKIGLLAITAVILIVTFLFFKLGNNWDYALPKRSYKIAAIVLTGFAIAFATTIFQTITNNRILTPNILGLDSLYMLLQTALLFVVGSSNLTFLNKNVNFFISTAIMILFASLLYQVLFRRAGSHLYLLLLVGLILGTFFQSMSSFMQVLIDPNEFLQIQDKMFASFSNIQSDLLYISVIVIIVTLIWYRPNMKYLDALSLGRDNAINLGIEVEPLIKKSLFVVTVLISISTALVGPITFLGLLVINLAHQFMKTYQHKYLLASSALFGIIALVGGQLLVERVFEYSTTVSVMINFIGGIYFLYLLLKENSSVRS
ncbi:iron chelate uptake ABC transporter family permease subunit [Risungbinella massiliensis]|uniref:iron chelate uptake ABC transporter family permease subunit n=1 Tax=Risungbinella massiliensis TaxID=1329796 RepID=UPI0005CB927A|nr:iron chelate uptake ABC transporter family permease subunit [Risungbinella massiliensis]